MNRCHCELGFAGPDCAIVVPITTAAPTEAPITPENTIKMEKKETPYGKLIAAMTLTSNFRLIFSTHFGIH